MTARERLVRRRLEESVHSKQAMLAEESACISLAAAAADEIVRALRAGGKVIFFGNGGSAMDAGHLAAELLGRFYRDRPALPSVSLPDSTAAMTAIGNDYEYAEVFARQVAGLGRPGDVLVGLSTSGRSANVVRAIAVGRDMGMVTVALTGADGGDLASVAAICIRVPTTDTPRVQEACMHLGHTICEIVEAEMFPTDPGTDES